MSEVAEPVVPQDKQSLRRQLRAQRRSLAPQRDRGIDADAIAATLSAFLDTLPLTSSGTGEHSAYSRPPCVAIYRSTPVEPPTEALADMLHARGVSVLVPETLPDLDLEWRELRADGSEGPRLGLEAIGAARVILTPALAIDHEGTRLGQGGGCYDKALPRRHPDAVVVALVNDEEYAAWLLPHDPHDVGVNAVITPGGGFRPIHGAGSVP
ncbi:MAG: 5-formyltetrahydrofolate cyclo-ligase [Dermatophilaceae bacterium]